MCIIGHFFARGVFPFRMPKGEFLKSGSFTGRERGRVLKTPGIKVKRLPDANSRLLVALPSVGRLCGSAARRLRSAEPSSEGVSRRVVAHEESDGYPRNEHIVMRLLFIHLKIGPALWDTLRVCKFTTSVFR